MPFAGDYLWIDAQGGQTFGVWTDWRNTVPGIDPREPASDVTGADVKQCRDATGRRHLGGRTPARAPEASTRTSTETTLPDATPRTPGPNGPGVTD